MKAPFLKRLYYWAFKNEILIAAIAFEKKKEERDERIRKAFRELQTWSDIPMDMQHDTIASILGFSWRENIRDILILMCGLNEREGIKRLRSKVPFTPYLSNNIERETERAFQLLKAHQNPRDSFKLLEDEFKKSVALINLKFKWDTRGKMGFLESLLPFEYYWDKLVPISPKHQNKTH